MKRKSLWDVSKEESEILDEFPNLPPEYRILAYRLALQTKSRRYWVRVAQILCFLLGALLSPIVATLVSLALKK
jgi:hypothetical protein